MVTQSGALEWLSVESENMTSFSRLEGRMTIGSAFSNSLILNGKGIRPLHAQIRSENSQIVFEDFINSSSEEFHPGEEKFLGSFKLKVWDSHQFWATYHDSILQSFREILKKKANFDLDKSFLELKRDLFFDREIPFLVQEKLRSIHQEFDLMGPIERLLQNSRITDVLVEQFDRIWIETDGRLQLSDEKFSSDSAYILYIQNLLAKIHKSIDEVHPYLDFNLPDGSRAHVIGAPLTPGGFYLSIRKPNEKFWSLHDLQALEMLTIEQYEILQRALSEKYNILISGATGTGKTTLLKACLAEIPENERVLILEDTPEITAARKNTIFLRSRTESQSQFPPIFLRDLVRQSLRMRPDRLVLGEVRGAEALDLLHAMNTGHRGCLGSLHSNSARDALGRLEGLIQMADGSLSESVTRDLIVRNIQMVVQVSKRGGKRIVSEIAWLRGIDLNRILLETIER